MREAGQIQSPSRLFANTVGAPIGQGVIVGIRRELTHFDFAGAVQMPRLRPAGVASLDDASNSRIAHLAGGWRGTGGGTNTSNTTNNSKQTVVNITVPNVSSAKELADITRFNAQFHGG